MRKVMRNYPKSRLKNLWQDYLQIKYEAFESFRKKWLLKSKKKRKKEKRIRSNIAK